MASDAERNKQIINDFFVGLFNDILLLEERHLKKMGLADLSLSEVHILEAIAQKENPAMGDVAQQVSLTNGTVSHRGQGSWRKKAMLSVSAICTTAASSACV